MFAEGMPPSCTITGVVGSLKNCKGSEDAIVGDGNLLLKINMGKNATDKHAPMPKSIVTGEGSFFYTDAGIRSRPRRDHAQAAVRRPTGEPVLSGGVL
jgi:hypothetical protein